MKPILLLLAVGLLSQSCAPERPIPVVNNPQIAQSVVPSVQRAIIVQQKIKDTATAQQINIKAADADITKSLEYAAMLKPYTDVDSNGISLQTGLVRSLNSADTHIELLTLANMALIADGEASQKILEEALLYSQNKDTESAQWLVVSAVKDEVIANLNAKLVESVEQTTSLKLKLEDAAVYKKAVIALVGLIFSYFVFRAVASVWSPFSKF
jgi:hypothetical protein